MVTCSTIRSFNELCFTTRVTSDVTCEKCLADFFSFMKPSILYQLFYSQTLIKKNLLNSFFHDESRKREREGKWCDRLLFTLPPFHISHLISQSLPFRIQILSHFLRVAKGSIEEDECSFHYSFKGRKKEERVQLLKEEESNKSSPSLPFHPSLYTFCAVFHLKLYPNKKLFCVSKLQM